MASFVLIGLCLSLIHILMAQNNLPLFDPVTCHNMCKVKGDCPANAACMPIVGSDRCGVCVCVFGYVPESGRCVQRNPDDKRIGVTAQDLDRTRSVSVNTSPTATANNIDWDCSQYECNQGDEAFAQRDNKPFQITPVTINVGGCTKDAFEVSTPCRNQQGGSQCAGGGKCLTVSPSISYCVCPYQRAGLSCQTEKPNTCRKADGNVPESVISGKRYQHIRQVHVGSIYARHFAPSFDHCVRLCQWAGTSRCRSINFGSINGQSVCELLTVWAHSASPLHQWLNNESGWKYACCFRSSSQQN